MYKPGTELYINKRWAATAAGELGFDVETIHPCSSTGWQPMLLLGPQYKLWRITVTESGPNAAEKFLPQLGDTVLAWCYPDADPQPPAMEVVHRLGDCDQDWCTFDITPDGSQIKRILERNGIPFPQFSEVIEP